MHSKYCILIIVLYLFTGCTRSDTNISEETAPRTFQDIEDDFRAFEFKPGVNYFYVQSYGYENAGFYNFEIILPPAENSEIIPLIIFFSTPNLENNNGAYSFVNSRCLIEAIAESMEAVILVLDSWHLDFFENKSKDKVMKITMIELARKFLAVDSSKTLITGFEYGADDSLYFVENYPDLFSAAIPIASNPNLIFSSSEITTTGVPIYLILGEHQFSLSQPILEQIELFVQESNNNEVR